LLFFRRVSRVIRDLVRVVPGPRSLALLPALLLTACLGMPEGVQPVENFEAQRYLGRWYEIARLDHSFERDLVNVTAEYSRREDGAVVVRNRGFDSEDGEWDDIEGVARFVEGENRAYLKVSFFGPFYGSYVVFDLDREAEDYGYAFVSGFNRDYLWLLSREPTVPDSVKADFLRQAESLGFPVGELIWVPQESAAPE
jgi:apolipoprotein D and lipocalin family protein